MKRFFKKTLALFMALVLVAGVMTIGFVNGDLKLEAKAIDINDSSIYLAAGKFKPVYTLCHNHDDQKTGDTSWF